MTPLRKARLAKNMSVLMLSQLSGIKRTRLDNLEVGHTKIAPDEAVKLSKILEAKIKSNTKIGGFYQ